ncbi:uncharacterized protein MONOS_7802 [Monocercomonoides exilis]|uniref:uncharacterized protein n=1 Tax=Monocercomonoides exilis TaxID=2049356 RepID=UPI00355962C7|nr:hypothetical protein MONOS_7802 [Monocercomonoides exilis]|eukprot:MONOS_7802.1-p1 / transcript=MONOS_7802.1 / gene=MONOS_7802 / organism=Monocercomonoides_exilis_PA203 / gene_product=unspecified product / transcript_product=unspecified product / location=Mono_scaffold00276:63543-65636(-) / protein_length=397 / sequence_SO=supercontig / SO=protein_coding / is_pseudo=false
MVYYDYYSVYLSQNNPFYECYTTNTDEKRVCYGYWTSDWAYQHTDKKDWLKFKTIYVGVSVDDTNNLYGMTETAPCKTVGQAVWVSMVQLISTITVLGGKHVSEEKTISVGEKKIIITGRGKTVSVIGTSALSTSSPTLRKHAAIGLSFYVHLQSTIFLICAAFSHPLPSVQSHSDFVDRTRKTLLSAAKDGKSEPFSSSKEAHSALFQHFGCAECVNRNGRDNGSWREKELQGTLRSSARFMTPPRSEEREVQVQMEEAKKADFRCKLSAEQRKGRQKEEPKLVQAATERRRRDMRREEGGYDKDEQQQISCSFDTSLSSTQLHTQNITASSAFVNPSFSQFHYTQLSTSSVLDTHHRSPSHCHLPPQTPLQYYSKTTGTTSPLLIEFRVEDKII